MPSYTTNLNLTKSTVGADTDQWGGHLNGNADTIDGIFAGAGNGTSVGLNVGTGKTLDVSSGTLTLADNQISGDKVEGGTVNAITINTLTTNGINVGSAAESDHKIAFLGNSETFHIGIDDSADDLVIGKGLTLGTEPRIEFNGQGAVKIISDAPANGQLTLADIGANADQAFFKQDGGTLSILAQQSTTQTGTVIIGGQNNSTSPTYASFAGTGVTLNGASIVVSTGSLFLSSSSSQGIHLQSPNGTEYKITVDNSGNLVATEQ
jgi:hypothetical protein